VKIAKKEKEEKRAILTSFVAVSHCDILARAYRTESGMRKLLFLIGRHKNRGKENDS
jgi:hypothetical protein